MNITVVTLFPQLFEPFISSSLVGRAQDKGVVDIELQNMFRFCAPKQRVDSPSFGHGAGMLVRPDITQAAIEDADARRGKSFKIFFSPQGKKLDQFVLRSIYERMQEQQLTHLMMVSARYEGLDARVEEYYADEMISVGDFVLMGGDLPAMIFLEGFLRLVPGVVGKESSVVEDSFTQYLVDYPQYTAPVKWNGLTVPEVIRSGDHKAMEQWRRSKALTKTVREHFDWVRSFELDTKKREEVARYIPPHYVVLMHDEVLLKDGSVGTSSVTSLDIHDIARSSSTYGLKGFYIVTSLRDQQAIVSTLTSFWHSAVGENYNPHRYQAMSHVHLKSSLDEVIADIAERDGSAPLTVATGAKGYGHPHLITYNDQTELWKTQKPVLIILGTSHGLAPQVIERSNYLLSPIYGFTEFNHLSVRSAASIIFDRWLGIQAANRSRLAARIK